MLAQNEPITKTTLLTGDPEFCKSFLFETAVSCAKEGQRVFYFASKKLESLPPTFHGRSEPSADALKFITFIYTATYEDLAGQLLRVQLFSSPPSVLMIDDLEHFSTQSGALPRRVNVARLCALLLRAAMLCTETLGRSARVCATSYNPDGDLGSVYSKYFDDHWTVHVEASQNSEEGQKVWLKGNNIFNRPAGAVWMEFLRLRDAALVMRRIFSSEMETREVE